MEKTAPEDPAPRGADRPARDESVNLWLLPLFQAAAFGYAVIPFLWVLTSARGLDFNAYAALQSIYYCTTLIAEVPTGLLADRLGRRVVLTLAAVAQIAGFVGFARASSFESFAAAEILLGLGQAMLSGTTSAMLYDSLQALGREREYLKWESRSTVARLGGSSVSFLVGGILASVWGFESAAWASGVFSLAALGIATRLIEPRGRRDSHASPPILRLLGASVRDLWARADLRWVAAMFALLFVELRTAFHLYTPGLERVGVVEAIPIGVAYALLNAVAAISTRAAHRLAAGLGEGALLVLLSLTLSVSFAALSWSRGATVVLLCFFLQQIPFGVHFPIVASFVNHRVGSSRRATVLSCLSLLGRASFALSFPWIGELADSLGLPRALLLISAAFCGLTLVLGFVGRQLKSLSEGMPPPAP